MDYCKYHPLLTATHKCNTCHTYNCDDCCNEASRASHGVCYICQNELTRLSVSTNIEPFWRRLQESFQYPNNFDSILLIIGLSVLTAITMFIPFSLLINLLLTSALLKYSFSCLYNTSHGKMDAPDMGDAYGGGFGLALQVIFMVMCISGVIWATSYLLGNMLASIVAIVLISGFPAMMINFAMSESLIEALNPVKMIKLMTSIGLPYGLLLGFIMIMTGSIGIIQQFISTDYSFIASVLQSMVSNYYIIVIFHLMGYMIYQYQDELGFETVIVRNPNHISKSVLDKNLTHFDILLKEGEFHEAIEIFTEIIKTYPEEDLKHDYFELLIAAKNSRYLNEFASQYLEYLLKSNREDQISIAYKRVLKIIPYFKPNTPELRFKLSSICHLRGDSRSVIKLVNGLHKDFPEYKNLIEAYEMMYKALMNLPNLHEQAQKCRILINKL